ncbi:MAG: ATP phosphoribosyltransferase regulatory subunit [Oscillospiraceae bacterium]|jgi:ATP phosphoribosyltransferase regulatory subunit|nr:ATP phosphoribosyltransferase regulatory subunit [Oscillospiraceae bacterium]
MRRYAKITPEGTTDYLFEECAARETALAALTRLFESWGYRRIATPHLEFYDVFHRMSADWLAEQLYCVTDSSGRLLVLRPDSTLPIARVISTRLQDAALPLRLYYHQSVFRRSRRYAGLSDEGLQSGVELLGAGGLRADLEILRCAVDALRACEAPRFRIELGHAAIFRSLADSLGAPDELRDALAQAIETKNLPALTQLLVPCSGSAAESLRQLPRLFGGAEVLDQARELFWDPAAREALDHLTELRKSLRILGLQDCVDFDLGLVHGRQYYTGMVFRGYIEGSGVTVLSGGRYDALLQEFGRPAAAVGFAVEVDPLAKALPETGAAPQPPAAALLVFGPAGSEAAALRYLEDKRAAGVRCEFAMAETLAEVRDYARQHGIARLAVVSGSGAAEESAV